MKRTLSSLAAAMSIVASVFSGTSFAATSMDGSIQVALVPLDGFPLEVSTSCDKGAAIFRVKNAGEKLTSPVTFNIVKLTDGAVVSKRRMKLLAGQAATFKIKDADKVVETFGLFMEADWIERSRTVDASVRCS